jgi:DNA repair protein RecO (recombination protein O)
MSSQPHDRYRQRLFRVEAIVLRHVDWGEADRLLWLYTAEIGKIKAVAKGVRKPRSRKAGHLEPFTRVHLMLARGRDLPIVTQAEMDDAYQPLREDLLRATYASYAVELLDRFTYEEGENRGLYHLLNVTLSRLCGPASLDLVVRYYEFRLLDFVGFRPQLFNCVVCGSQILPQDQFFSAALGGAVCPGCASSTESARPLSLNALKYMRHFQRSQFEDLQGVELSTELNREIENMMQHYLTYLLERGLNTPAFLRRVRKGVVETAVEQLDDLD